MYAFIILAPLALLVSQVAAAQDLVTSGVYDLTDRNGVYIRDVNWKNCTGTTICDDLHTRAYMMQSDGQNWYIAPLVTAHEPTCNLRYWSWAMRGRIQSGIPKTFAMNSSLAWADDSSRVRVSASDADSFKVDFTSGRACTITYNRANNTQLFDNARNSLYPSRSATRVESSFGYRMQLGALTIGSALLALIV